MKKLLFVLLLTIPFIGFGQNNTYHENGQIKFEYTGEFPSFYLKTYYENGQVENEGYYKNDKTDGFGRIYYENGQLEWEGNFKDGELISEKCWNEKGKEIECK